MFDDKTHELIAVGASITANCQPCLDYHTAKARELGVSDEDIQAAVKVGQLVRRGATAKMDRFAAQVVGQEQNPVSPPAGCECR